MRVQGNFVFNTTCHSHTCDRGCIHYKSPWNGRYSCNCIGESTSFLKQEVRALLIVFARTSQRKINMALCNDEDILKACSCLNYSNQHSSYWLKQQFSFCQTELPGRRQYARVLRSCVHSVCDYPETRRKEMKQLRRHFSSQCKRLFRRKCDAKHCAHLSRRSTQSNGQGPFITASEHTVVTIQRNPINNFRKSLYTETAPRSLWLIMHSRKSVQYITSHVYSKYVKEVICA